jgi:hypothetical protein
MNLNVIPLLIVALLMISGDPAVDTVQMILSGEHEVRDDPGALIVGDAEVSVPVGARIPGPVYVIGGELSVAGVVETDVIQLAGTVRVGDGAGIGDELQHIAGTLVVSPDAEVGRRTSLDLPAAGAGHPTMGVTSAMLSMLLLAGAGYLLAGKRTRPLDNVAGAVAGHPVVTLTVGLLLALTAVSVLAFMAFTLVLIPVALLGLLAGVLTLIYGLVAWGHLIGSRLPIRRRRRATAIGAALVVGGLQLAGLIPLVGDLIVLGVLLTGVGAVVVTYFGVARFRPDPLPE